MAEAPKAGSQDVETLKRRGRRRLVGAIALVLAAVVILPMIFDTEPRRSPPVSVRIPGEDDPAFVPKVVPKSAPLPTPAPDSKAKPAAEPKPQAEAKPEPPAVPEAKPAAPQPEAPKAEAKPAPAKSVLEKPAAKVEPKKAAPTEAERKRAEAALAGAGPQFVVPVGAFSTEEKLKELADKLSAAKVPYYTEPLATEKGKVTRVRAGPFASREAAQGALEKLKGLGLKPGNPIAK